MATGSGSLENSSSAGARRVARRLGWAPLGWAPLGSGVGAALAVIALLAGCADGTPASPSSSATPASSSVTATPSGAPLTVPAYYMVDTRAGLRLARELRETTGTDPLRAAVEQMIAGPHDPDYTSPWNKATKVLSVTKGSDAITVDLSVEARTANIGSAGAALMIQQLAYTVTDAADSPKTPVMLNIDGEPAGELWGVVMWVMPITRGDPLDVRLLVQIDTPGEGATVASPVTVKGDAAVFEAVLHWKVLSTSGSEVSSGTTMTAEGQTFAPYSFSVPLEPGTYTVVITEDDPSDGEGGTPESDSRTITVS